MRSGFLSRFSVSARILSVVSLSVLGLALVGWLGARSMSFQMYQDRRDEVGYVLDTAVHIVDYYQGQSAKGALSEAEAKHQAAETLRQMRYNNGEYIFIVATDGTSVLQPAKPESEGGNLLSVKDADGVALFQSLIDTAKAGKGEFVQYRWARPGAAEPKSKLSKGLLFQPWNWVIGSGIYLDNMESAVAEAVWGLVLSVGLVVVVVVLLALMVSRSVTIPMKRLTLCMHRLAGHDLTAEVVGVDGSDELSAMARAVQIFKDNMLQVDELRRQQEETRLQSEKERARALSEMADNFEASVNSKVLEVEGSSEAIRKTAHTMAERSQSSGSQSLNVGQAAKITMERSEVVAEATRQLSIAVDEVARQVAQSTEITRRAVDDVNATSSRMEELSSAVQSIGDIVNLINDIAAQTNLLALNATIEAARAGDAGKGFAVVASEVKTLANQTAKATEQISQQVASIQSSTEVMRASIQGVVATIRSVNDISTSIAGAIQEQEATTRDIASNIDEVAHQAGEVSGSVAHLSKAAAMACAGTIRVIWSAKTLTKTVDGLRGEADSFLKSVRG